MLLVTINLPLILTFLRLSYIKVKSAKNKCRNYETVHLFYSVFDISNEFLLQCLFCELNVAKRLHKTSLNNRGLL